jgi:hypothetical protein
VVLNVACDVVVVVVVVRVSQRRPRSPSPSRPTVNDDIDNIDNIISRHDSTVYINSVVDCSYHLELMWKMGPPGHGQVTCLVFHLPPAVPFHS